MSSLTLLGEDDGLRIPATSMPSTRHKSATTLSAPCGRAVAVSPGRPFADFFPSPPEPSGTLRNPPEPSGTPRSPSELFRFVLSCHELPRSLQCLPVYFRERAAHEPASDHRS